MPINIRMLRNRPKAQNMSLPQISEFVEYAPEEDVLDLIAELSDYEKTTEGITAKPSPWRDYTVNGQNIAFYAAGRSHHLGGAYEILLALKEAKFELSGQDFFKQHPLFYAARELNFEACELLVREGCSVRDLDKNGQTCLYYAVSYASQKNKRKVGKPSKEERRRRMTVIELLIENGAPIHSKDAHGHTVQNFCPPDDEFITRYFGKPDPKRRKMALGGNDPHWLLDHHSHPSKGSSSAASYYVAYAEPADTQHLSELENEFVEDHREILGKVFGEPPPFNVTCTALGLNSVNSNRRNIISAIATKCDKFARTLKAVSSETGLPVGYLYFKCTPGRRNNENEKEKQLEISHLKVNSEHNRRGLAQALFLGVLTHLWKEDMIEYAQDMRLSVFDANLSAIALYERLGFQQLNEPWYSAIKEWTGGPPEGREIGWRRYQRIRNKPEVMEDMDQVKSSQDKEATSGRRGRN